LSIEVLSEVQFTSLFPRKIAVCDLKLTQTARGWIWNVISKPRICVLTALKQVGFYNNRRFDLDVFVPTRGATKGQQ